ncbi:MAG TPA: hypothetical protein VGF96_09320 [Terracidiphilus sp.]|jgi:hypothetical protein
MNSLLSPATVENQTERDGPSYGSVYDTLLYTVFQKPRELDSAGTVVALSSPNRGAGVSYAARALVRELTKSELASVAGVNVGFLRRLHEPTMEAIHKSFAKFQARTGGGAWDTSPSKRPLALPERRGPWEGSWQYRRDCIELLRFEFDHTIIDCPSLEESGDVLSVAPFVDGVILVVEANKTRREQPRQAEQVIAAAGGKLLGYILNKRAQEVPDWLYRKL